MPGGDRTGPMGQGPMTGRRAGYCTGNMTPGYAVNQRGYFGGGGWGRGFRGGCGRGRGFGWGYGAANYYPVAAEDSHRISSLEQQARYLEDSLQAIRKEIEAAKSSKDKD